MLDARRAGSGAAWARTLAQRDAAAGREERAVVVKPERLLQVSGR